MEFTNLPERPCGLEMTIMQITEKTNRFRLSYCKKYIYFLMLEVTIIESFICCVNIFNLIVKSFNPISHLSSDEGKFSKL